MIALRSVHKSYDGGRTYAVRGVDLRVERGELLVLLGESGCGKTTTLKMINRLIELTEGTIEVEGEDHRAGTRWPCGGGSATCSRASACSRT